MFGLPFFSRSTSAASNRVRQERKQEINGTPPISPNQDIHDGWATAMESPNGIPMNTSQQIPMGLSRQQCVPFVNYGTHQQPTQQFGTQRPTAPPQQFGTQQPNAPQQFGTQQQRPASQQGTQQPPSQPRQQFEQLYSNPFDEGTPFDDPDPRDVPCDEKKGQRKKSDLSGEQRIYDALLELADEIYDLAEDMKSFQYPTKEKVKAKLEQESYSTGGLKQKGKTAELKVQSIMEDINVTRSLLDPLEKEIKIAQELCFYKDCYNSLYGTDYNIKENDKVARRQQRKNDLRILRGKTERRRKRAIIQRNNQIDNAINQATRIR